MVMGMDTEADRAAMLEHLDFFNRSIEGSPPSPIMVERNIKRLRDGRVYLLKVTKTDGSGPEKVVSLLSFPRLTPTSAAIGFVTTLPSNANRSYATQLVASATKMLLEQGRMPLLFSDTANPHSYAYCSILLRPFSIDNDVSFS